MKKCPFCAEEIQDEAVFCRYCHQWIEKPEENQAKEDTGPNDTVPNKIHITDASAVVAPATQPEEENREQKRKLWGRVLVFYTITQCVALFLYQATGFYLALPLVCPSVIGPLGFVVVYKNLHYSTNWHWILKSISALVLSTLLILIIWLGIGTLTDYGTDILKSDGIGTVSQQTYTKHTDVTLPPVTPTAVKNFNAKPVSPYMVCVITPALTIRSEPVLNGPPSQMLNEGDCLQVIAETADGEWLQVQHGWIYKPYTAPKASYKKTPTPMVATNRLIAKINQPAFCDLIVAGENITGSAVDDWDKWVAGHARNLSIPEPYAWEVYEADQGTVYQSIVNHYRDILVHQGYRMTFNEQGENNIYLLKFKKGQQIVTIQFWGADGKNDPSVLIFYQGW